mgnify:CR=1 FL=1
MGAGAEVHTPQAASSSDMDLPHARAWQFVRLRLALRPFDASLAPQGADIPGRASLVVFVSFGFCFALLCTYLLLVGSWLNCGVNGWVVCMVIHGTLAQPSVSYRCCGRCFISTVGPTTMEVPPRRRWSSDTLGQTLE